MAANDPGYKPPPPGNESMKAVRFHGKKDLRYEDVPIPQVRKGQVKIRPAWVGICGTDLHEYLGGPNLCPTTPHPITGEQVPLTFGHEFGGTVEEVGEGVTEYKKGDRVVVQPIIFDGTCGACLEGLHGACWSNGFIGLSGWGGGLAEHITVPLNALYHVPDNVPLDVAALVEPLAVGWHAVKASPFKEGDACLILGGGPIGISVILALKARKVGKIIVSEVSRKRSQFAKDFGADFVVDPTKEDLVKRVRELTDGQGAHVVFDAAGVQSALDQAVHATRVRGTIVNIAIWEGRLNLVGNDMTFKERRYQGVATYCIGDFEEVMDAISKGEMKPGGMITSRIKLTEVEEKGFRGLIEDKDNQVKILVEVGGEK